MLTLENKKIPERQGRYRTGCRISETYISLTPQKHGDSYRICMPLPQMQQKVKIY